MTSVNDFFFMETSDAPYTSYLVVPPGLLAGIATTSDKKEADHSSAAHTVENVLLGRYIAKGSSTNNSQSVDQPNSHEHSCQQWTGAVIDMRFMRKTALLFSSMRLKLLRRAPRYANTEHRGTIRGYAPADWSQEPPENEKKKNSKLVAAGTK